MSQWLLSTKLTGARSHFIQLEHPENSKEQQAYRCARGARALVRINWIKKSFSCYGKSFPTIERYSFATVQKMHSPSSKNAINASLRPMKSRRKTLTVNSVQLVFVSVGTVSLKRRKHEVKKKSCHSLAIQYSFFLLRLIVSYNFLIAIFSFSVFVNFLFDKFVVEISIQRGLSFGIWTIGYRNNLITNDFHATIQTLLYAY